MRFMLRVDDATRMKLEELSAHFHTAAADVIRQLIAQARPEDFPISWRRRATEHDTVPPRRQHDPAGHA